MKENKPPKPIKIIALIPFKNEDWVLVEYINSIKKITNFIIAYDDSSTDKGRNLLENAGAKIITENYKEKSGWAEHSIRECLLREGRAEGGTHFICLDADEVFSDNFYLSAKQHILSLTPGQSLWMDWVNLYGNKETERIDGVYKKLNKSFIFCDDKKATFSYAFLGVSRTPGDPLNRLVIPREKGAVIHFQFLNTQRADMKRIWYMCSELIKGTRSALRINTTYDIQKDRTTTKTRQLPKNSTFTIINNDITKYNQITDWRFLEIKQWFDVYGIAFFEDLDIWDNEILKKQFIGRENRAPKPKKPHPLIITINNTRNTIKIIFKMLYSKNNS